MNLPIKLLRTRGTGNFSYSFIYILNKCIYILFSSSLCNNRFFPVLGVLRPVLTPFVIGHVERRCQNERVGHC